MSMPIMRGMDIYYVIFVVISLLLLIYLTYVILYPERF
ncbi:MAG: K(+)-transporting ATPase subunit F [Halobacteriota archaeon]